MSDTCPQNCTFSYHSVIPPTHCPYCGRCLGCGGPQVAPYQPYTPWYPSPYPYPGPIWYYQTSPKITIDTNVAQPPRTSYTINYTSEARY